MPQPAETPAQALLDKVLDWLPADSETLVVARGPFKIEIHKKPSDDQGDDAEGEDEDITLERTIQAWPQWSISTIRDGRFHRDMANWEVTLAAKGSRKFRRPKGLGAFLYEGCDVVILKDGSVLDPLMKRIEKDAEESFDLRGCRILVYRETLEKDQWTFLVGRPKPNVLLCATDRGFLVDLLGRMEKPSEPRAFPRDLPEWKLLDSSARVWAIRHYIRGDEDYYSHSFKEDASAKGLVFFSSEDARTVRVRVLSESDHSFKEVAGNFHRPREGLIAQVAHEKGVIEVTAMCDSTKATSSFVFVLLAYLGHSIFI